MVVNGIALRFVMVVRFVHPLNAEPPIVASWLVEFRVTPRRFVRPRNADAAIDVALSGRVTYWTVVPMKVEILGIVVIVLVFRKTMVLKDGQDTGAVVRYGMLDTSRNSVVNLGRVLNNTPLPLSVVMEGDNVKENSLALVNVSFIIVVSVLLRDKSKEPERFAQPLNARLPRVRNDIGAKVSNPVIIGGAVPVKPKPAF